MPDTTPEPPSIEASWFERTPTIDPADWSEVPGYPLALSRDRSHAGHQVQEPGRLRLAQTRDALLLRVDMQDRDVVTLAKHDGDDLHTLGDVIEWFIGRPPITPLDPEAAAGPGNRRLPAPYVELHVAPNGLRTAYRFVHSGLLERLDTAPFTAEVATAASLDHSAGIDTGWAVFNTLPRAGLAKLLGVDTDPGLTHTPLTMFVGRYNFGRHLASPAGEEARPELTMWPAQPQTRYHLRDHHAPVVLSRC